MPSVSNNMLRPTASNDVEVPAPTSKKRKLIFAGRNLTGNLITLYLLYRMMVLWLSAASNAAVDVDADECYEFLLSRGQSMRRWKLASKDSRGERPTEPANVNRAKEPSRPSQALRISSKVTLENGETPLSLLDNREVYCEHLDSILNTPCISRCSSSWY